jgi:hypothetical protein
MKKKYVKKSIDISRSIATVALHNLLVITHQRFKKIRRHNFSDLVYYIDLCRGIPIHQDHAPAES